MAKVKSKRKTEQERKCPCCEYMAAAPGRVIQTEPVHVGQRVPVVDDLIAVIDDDDQVVALADANHHIIATGEEMARFVEEHYGCTAIRVREIPERSLGAQA